jgi:D-3-phosphoglycerate dehydrogenase
MKILVTPTSFEKPQNDQAREMLEKFADEVVYNPYGRPLEAKEVAKLAKGCDGYIAGLDYITADAFEGMDKMKIISRYGAGVDRVELDVAKARSIKVTNTPGTNAVAVCELAFGLMLSLARAIPRLNKAVEAGKWPRNNGVELKGKTLSIFGLGAIGRNLAQRAIAFGMDVCAYDPYINEAYAKEKGIKVCTFDEAIAAGDFISLHMPLMEATKHCISKKAIDKMKKGVFLINTARGGLIDEAAAYEALKSGKMAGLGLDAYECEPVIDSPLVSMDNVISTPHTGAHTNEAISGMGMMATENLIAVLSGEPCKSVIV